ncbi:MAG: hypothetical protein HXX17_04205 [Geobacteraceae bacterium]|nr:hypothetical protein [Geobacteraceae bacterium]
MKRLVLIVFFGVGLLGCSTFNGPTSSIISRYEANRKLSSAIQEVERGRYSAAIAIFEEIIAEPGINGVTDEALFRVSLLKLLYEEKDGGVSSLRYLEMLRSYFPESSWTQQSKTLYEFVKGAVEAKKQNRNLKIHNLSLTKDNKDLHQSIDRLKSLDMKLERKMP